MRLIYSIIIILIIVFAFVLGFFISKLSDYSSKDYTNCTNIYNNHKSTKHCNDGYYFENTPKPKFEYGDWICVNIEYMDFNRAFEVCKHETFHEIWAECGESNNLSYCIKQNEGDYYKYKDLKL